ncbi:MAG TPA: ATP-binding protein [Gemmatimonadales bacterium]|nr:ATP-binding protein [Gemmatimonadales bacterium]
MGKPSLKTELLFNLAFLAAAALLLGVASILALEALTAGLTSGELLPLVLVTVAVDVGIFIIFGRYIVTRHVLRPVERLMNAADAVASGDLGARAPDAETQDFTSLGERLNRMTDRLLDAQSQLVRSEKLASVGLLAAGVAHEIGNPLGAIGTYLEVERRRGGDSEIIGGMTRELERIDKIVRGLLEYARPKDEAVQSLDVKAVMEAAFELMRAQGAFKKCNPQLDVGSDVPRVRGRAHALEQALVNLLLNAVDATPAQGPVIMGVRRWHFDPEEVGLSRHRSTDSGTRTFTRAHQRRPSLPPIPDLDAGAVGALLFIVDGGPGVPKEDRARVFEPFYTTKEPGRGTGLGLAIVQRTVFDMGGLVWVEQAREGGAAFKLFLPQAVEATS